VSPTGSGGKSLVAANLGLVWGRSDERVLVIDTETRAKAEAWPLSTLDTGGKDHAGLGEFLTYRAQDLEEIATQSCLPGVDLVTRGVEDSLPDLLGSNRFRDLLESVSKTYSLVMLEAPPVLGFADAAIVAKNCDAVIVCIRARSVTPREVEQAIAELGHRRVLGIIFTDVIPAFNRE
jgi:Mrp family chromosome partitioning ATPase